MILSASRRTDIPNYYSDWFFNRIQEGFLYVRNPMNAHQVSKVILSPEIVDCIVFWTKNPAPMLPRLHELDAYPYYFQFTLTGYGRDIEHHIPHKKTVILPIFQQLSHELGADRVIWRYDPIIFTDHYTPDYHIQAFGQIAKALCGHTTSCVISFVDYYVKNQKNMQNLHSYSLAGNDLNAFAKELATIAHSHGISVKTCAESIDLSYYNTGHSCCIDKDLIEKITGCKIHAGKDKNQRKECGCIESIEIGAYDTCQNGCLYCYANHSPKLISQNCGLYDADSPLLCGKLTEKDKITVRKVKSLKETQMTLEGFF